jgi:hypothetical protein
MEQSNIDLINNSLRTEAMLIEKYIKDYSVEQIMKCNDESELIEIHNNLDIAENELKIIKEKLFYRISKCNK